ncbi:MAG: hypothetical protein IJ061_03810, partial [Lachnospiraceae bacterium]|nr:hypothetical protein [Lachnospiraceae bacterium]
MKCIDYCGMCAPRTHRQPGLISPAVFNGCFHFQLPVFLFSSILRLHRSALVVALSGCIDRPAVDHRVGDHFAVRADVVPDMGIPPAKDCCLILLFNLLSFKTFKYLFRSILSNILEIYIIH